MWRKTKDAVFGDIVYLLDDTSWSIRKNGRAGREYRVIYAGNAIQDFRTLKEAKKTVEHNQQENYCPLV